jgi:hypothetical protein
VTGFLRSNRGVESETDDTFIIILQYSGKQKNLLVEVKTAIVTHMKDQLRFFVRGTKGTYLKVRRPMNPVVIGGSFADRRSLGRVRKRARPLRPPGSRPRAPSLASKMSGSGAP